MVYGRTDRDGLATIAVEAMRFIFSTSYELPLQRANVAIVIAKFFKKLKCYRHFNKTLYWRGNNYFFKTRRVSFVKYAKDDSVVVVLSAICGNLLLTIAKFLGWLVSRSPSMLAEAIHSFADT